MRPFHLTLALALVSSAAGAQTVLYDTFNEGDQANLFDCCSAAAVGGLGPQGRALVSVPFTAPVKTHIVEIDLPLSHTDGDANMMQIVIVGEHGDKHSFRVSRLDDPGQCCAFKAAEAKGVAVAPGVNYSILVHGVKRTLGAWNLNSAGADGSYSVSNDSGATWTQVDGALPALRIIGR